MFRKREVSVASLRGPVAAGSAIIAGLGLLVGSPASASTNLVQNGSFEGANGLSSWEVGGTAADGYLPVAIAYNQSSAYPTGAQGEVVPVDNAGSVDPDSSGSEGVYFVSDEARNLSVYQSVYLKPGSYDIGFDSYETFNGSSQPHDAILTAEIAGVQLASFALSSGDVGVWNSHQGEANILAAGNYLVSFVFNTPDTPPNANPANPDGIYNAKDVVIDRAFVVADPSGGGTPISAAPEPSTWALMLGGVGLLGLALRSRRRGSQAACVTAA